MKIRMTSWFLAIIFLVLGAVGGAIGGFALAINTMPEPAYQFLSEARTAAANLVAPDGSPRSAEYMRSIQHSILALDTVLVAQMFDGLSKASHRDAAVELAQRIERQPLLQMPGNDEMARDAKLARRCIIDHHTRPAEVVQCTIRNHAATRNGDASGSAQAD